MILVFYSDQIIEENKRIDHRLLEGLTPSEVTIGYIPSGGDPIYFLNNMKRRIFLSVLQSFAAKGGTIVGVSGGGVLLGKNAALFKLFQNDLTTAFEHRDNLKALGLVNFEFLPHYNRWNDSFKQAVEKYTSMTDATVYACDDGSGIIVEENKTDFIGTVYQIEDGVTRKVSF